MIRVFRTYVSPRKVIFILGEGLLIYWAVALTSFILLDEGKSFLDLLEITWIKILLVAIVAQLSLYLNDLYEVNAEGDIMDIATRLIQSVGITSIILAIVYFFWPHVIIGQWIFFGSIVLLLFFLVSWRLLYTLIISRKFFAEKTIIVGSGALSSDIMKEMDNRKDISYHIRSIIGHMNESVNSPDFGGVPVHYGFEKICDSVEKEQASSIIVAMDEKRGLLPYKELLKCKVKGITIVDGESFYERITGKILVEKINPSWLIFSDGFVKSKAAKFIKRLTGLFFASFMLVFLSPLMLIVALIIKTESKGPVIFSQERVGENEVPFILHKFRSMRADAESASGPVWAEEEDPRITRVGKIIRKFRIDELPQLWNIFKGDMSFVGPRPERAFFVEQLKKKVPYYGERFSVKPGLTGWAQVKYPYGATDEDALEKLKYDLYYIKNLSLLMDFIVIFHTVKIVLLKRGAR